MSEWTLNTDSMGRLTITVEGEEWEKAVDKSFRKIAREIELPGFRKGKAPKNMLLKRLNMQSVYYEAFKTNIDSWLGKAVLEHNLKVISQPQVVGTPSFSKSNATVTIDLEVFPTGKIADYSGIEYKVEEPEVTDAMVQAELEDLRRRYTEIEEIDGEAGRDNIVNIDFEGFIDDVAFDGGKASSYDLTLGSNSFIPGFEDQLIGAKAGDEKEIVVTFPEDYSNENIAGKEAVFKVKVNNVKKETIPEVDDNFAEDVNFPNVSTVDELMDYLKGAIAKSLKGKLEQQAERRLEAEVADLCLNEIPGHLIEERAKEMLNNAFTNVQNAGYSVSQYIQLTGKGTEEMLEEMKGNAEQSLKFELAIDAIGKAEGITVTDEEVKESLRESAEELEMNAEELLNQVNFDDVKQEILQRKVIDFLKGKGTVTEGEEAE